MNLSTIPTSLSHKQDAEYHLALANAIQFLPEDDPFIPALDFDLSHKIVMEGSLDRKIGELEEKKGFAARAHSWYEKAATALAQKLPQSGDFPERILIELLNQQGSIAEKLGNKGNFIVYVKDGVQRARAIGSTKREKEAWANVQTEKRRWPHEKDVLKLDELFIEDGEG